MQLFGVTNEAYLQRGIDFLVKLTYDGHADKLAAN